MSQCTKQLLSVHAGLNKKFLPIAGKCPTSRCMVIPIVHVYYDILDISNRHNHTQNYHPANALRLQSEIQSCSSTALLIHLYMHTCTRSRSLRYTSSRLRLGVGRPPAVEDEP